MAAKKTTILVADDDPQLLRLVARNLELDGYQVRTAIDGQEALDAITTAPPDLAVLDVMMPRLDGFAVCQQVREFSSLPIMMLTARGHDQDKVRGFDLGADDYLTKPFSIGELLGRVRAILRRTQNTVEGSHATQAQLTTGDLVIDFRQRLVTRSGREITLTPVEYRLLAYLALNTGRVITQDLLLEHIWGEEYVGESHLLQVNVNRLRHKLEDDPAHPRYLLTKTGIGYLLAAQ
ncbi:MAG TPA: response regulator transcription factor [Ktedonobacterales bacterium]|nr:response regulator transcription factor [Ktedonobacterales bacterium]